jgi:hypothetical protein
LLIWEKEEQQGVGPSEQREGGAAGVRLFDEEEKEEHEVTGLIKAV